MDKLISHLVFVDFYKLLFIILLALTFTVSMRAFCFGLWEWRDSKVPHNLLRSWEKPDYRSCEYVGLSGLLKKISKKD